MAKRMVFMLALFLTVSPYLVYGDTAQRIKSQVYVNTDKATAASMETMSVVTLYSYNIDGNNYFKLRDIAQILSNNNMGFSVFWDDTDGVIKIDTKEPYSSVGNELDYNRNKENIMFTCVPQNTTVIINGITHELKAYNIEGNTYFQLRELGRE